MSLIGALMAVLPAAKRFADGNRRTWADAGGNRRTLADVPDFPSGTSGTSVEVEKLRRSQVHLIDRIAELEGELKAERQYVKVLREAIQDANAEIARLLLASHRCQHQADLNRAMAQQQLAQAPGAGQIGGLGQCQLALHDCNMHQADLSEVMSRFIGLAPS
ncbi:MAG TPA: hypothetical protein VGG68_15670 [Caulobacteraceae bacterium]|jgi:hypothetical protein